MSEGGNVQEGKGPISVQLSGNPTAVTSVIIQRATVNASHRLIALIYVQQCVSGLGSGDGCVRVDWTRQRSKGFDTLR